MLRPSAHSVACCCVLLGDVAQSLKPVKLWANNSQHLFWSVIAEVYNSPFAQLLQQCWGHARELQMVYEVLWVKSFPRCTAGPNIVGSSRLHTTANTHATTPNIVAPLLRPFARSLKAMYALYWIAFRGAAKLFSGIVCRNTYPMCDSHP